MVPVQFSEALDLTGLKESQLREWCGKRGLYRPTVPARGSGRMALFTWQDIVALRVFRQITTDFGGHAAQWADGVAKLRHHLDGQSFLRLGGKAALFTDRFTVTLGPLSDASGARPILTIPLDPHLARIAAQAPPEAFQGELPLVTRIGSSR